MENRTTKKKVYKKATGSILFNSILYTELFLYEQFVVGECIRTSKMENYENADENMK